MLPSTIVRALTTPAFEPDHFTATQWSTAEDKAKFANALMKYIAQEFPRRSRQRAGAELVAGADAVWERAGWPGSITGLTRASSCSSRQGTPAR